MANSPRIAVQISAQDQYTAKINQLRKLLAAVADDADKVGKRTAAVSAPAFDFGRLRGGFDAFDRHVSSRLSIRGGIPGLSAAGSVAGGIPGLGGLAGVGAVAGIGEMVSHYAGLGVELTNVSRLAGTSAAGLNSLRGAARMVGLTAGDADQAMTGLNHSLADAAFGRNAQAATWFQRFGITFGNMRDGAVRAEQVLPQVADTLAAVAKQSPLAAERLAQLWGIPSSALPMMLRGADALQQNRAEIERLYGSMDNYQASSENFTRATARLSISAERLGMTIMTSLEPHLTPLLKGLSDWIDKPENRQGIGEAFDHIGHTITNIPWTEVGKGIQGVGHMAHEAAEGVDWLSTKWDNLNKTMKPFEDFMNQAAGGGGVLDALGRLLATQAPMPGTATERAMAAAVGQTLLPFNGASPRERAGFPTQGGGPRGGTSEDHANAQQIHDEFMRLGYNDAQAWGLAANALHENSGRVGGNPGDGGRSTGMFQWNAERRSRYIQMYGHDPSQGTVRENAQYMDWEIKHTEAANARRFLAARDPGEAAAALSTDVIRPRDKLQNELERSATARRIAGEGRQGVPPAEVTGTPLMLDPRTGRVPPPSPERLPDLLPPKPQATSDSAAGSTHQITIDLNGASQGATVRTQSQGDGAEIAGIRVRRAMPEAGLVWGGT